MADTSAAGFITAKAAHKAPGLNDEQVKNIAVGVARDGLTYDQATAKYAAQASAAAAGAHQARITAIVATKTSKNPHYAELVR